LRYLSAGTHGSADKVKSRFHRFLDLDNRILVDKHIKRGGDSMPTKHAFNPDRPLPFFLAAERMQGIGKAWDGAVISTRILRASILVATATAIGIAFLSAGDRVTLSADVAASLVDKSAPPPDTDQSSTTVQSTADAQALPPSAKEAPTRDEIVAAPESVGQSQMEDSEPSSEVLFRQYQAWAAEKDAQARVGQVQSVQDAPAQVAENARVPLRPMQKHRHVLPVHSARAEIRPVQNPRRKVRPEQAQVQDPSAQDARGQERSVQNAQAPSFLPTFGWHN
jgi:hypothetical protein